MQASLADRPGYTNRVPGIIRERYPRNRGLSPLSGRVATANQGKVGMRVLQIITRGDDVGGAQIHLLHMITGMVAEGHEVLVFTGTPGAFTDILDSHQIPWQSTTSLRRGIEPLADIKAVRALTRVIGEYKPMLVACHSSKAGILGRVAARITAKPVIFTAHGWAFTDGVSNPTKGIYRAVERLISKWTSAIICVSEYDREIALSAGIPPNKLCVVHNGIPDTTAAYREAPGSKRKRVVMVGRFDEQKDQSLLVRAAAQLMRIELHFVGDGPNLEATKSLAEVLQMAERCHFHGYQQDVEPFLRNSHVFCLVSNYEGFPISTVEAMRAGLPAIVSRVGGAGEAVEEGVTGFTVSRGDEGDLRMKIQQLVEDEEFRQAMGRAARQRFLDRYTFDAMYKSTIAVYRSVLGKR